MLTIVGQDFRYAMPALAAFGRALSGLHAPLTAFLPALRASRIDPMEALREE